MEDKKGIKQTDTETASSGHLDRLPGESYRDYVRRCKRRLTKECAEDLFGPLPKTEKTPDPETR